jgi:glycosyltransferase involved in cell wall biosynthesis
LVVGLPAQWTLPVAAGLVGALEDVIFIAQVEESELLNLYLAAEFVFQPSLYEGFGYPVAEAMSCGAAVIGTRVASIPEIAGEAALLVDPTDTVVGAEAIFHLATDAAARDALRARAQCQVAAFCEPERLGESTLACWRAAAASAAPKKRIALWSSMPPLDCGIADYTAELVDALADTLEVDVYTDGTYAPSARSAPNVHFRHPRDFDPGQPNLLHNIFQLQTREYQAFLFPALMAHRATVMLHDISIGGGFYVLEKERLRLREFEDRILAAEGPEAVRDFGRVLSIGGGAVDWKIMGEFLARHPLLRWAVAPPNCVQTHTDFLAQQTLRHYPDAQITVVRQGYGDRVPWGRYLPLPLWRHSLGLGPRGLVVGAFGIVGRSKRIEKAIAGFEGLWREHPDSLLLIVGSIYDQSYRAELTEAIAASPAVERIVLSDYAPPDVFHALVALCDVMVALRWPALGGLSAVLLRGLAAGKPVIVSDIPDFRGAGDEATLPVPVGEGEAEGIAKTLLRLARDPQERARLGYVARAWYHREATLQAMADDHIAGGRPPRATEDTDA